MRVWISGFRLPRLLPQHRRRLPPPLVLALGLLACMVAGTLLLRLPLATRVPIDWLTAVFTAASAVTVTGLVLVDTGATFTPFGQAVILLLIQAGGIGIVTFVALTLMVIGGRLGLGQQLLIREAMNHPRMTDFAALVRQVTVFVLALEAVGTVLLALVWVPELGWRQGLWFSLFHSVSAFNNAGFVLHETGMARWVVHPAINLVFMALVVLGSLGFMVLVELRHSWRWSKLSLHSRMMLSGTGVLLLVSASFFALLEWHNPETLGALPPAQRVWPALFQAVMPRSGGFATVDLGALEAPTTVLLILLMFIGGGTNSTAGGIKVTTFVVLLLATRAFLRGRDLPVAFGRTIPPGAVLRALAVTVLAMMLVVMAIFLISAAEPHLRPEDLLFEVVSAFATVGLSRGITAELSAPSQGLLIFLMFIGRVGPVGLVFLLARRQGTSIRYPEGDVHIG